MASLSIDQWNALGAAVAAFNSVKWDDRESAVSKLADLILNPLDPEEATREPEWQEVLLGSNTKINAVVRVKLDAYSNDRLASMHNGRVGRLVGTRNGLCVIRYDDDGLEFQHETVNVESRRV